MKESKFIDYKGSPQTQFDREPNDTDEDVLAKIEYAERVQVIINKPPFSVMLPLMDLLTFKALSKFKPLSVVNYGDRRYSSVVVEERYD
ncbi:MAG: hypothetical protein IKE23_08855 [Exiguobacterium sp.]|nr:hypothetical protein [Exiguobacterium sp.]